MQKELPEFLYHYTTIESLALILKNRTIRFNNLSDVDDLEEGVTNDLGRIGKSVFVSCWTDSDKENIPLWYMYSRSMSGVRIKLPIHQFGDKPDIFFGNTKDDDHESKGIFKSRISCDFEDPLMWSPWVRYTNNEKKLKPKLIKSVNVDGHMEKRIYAAGYVKRKCWEFQSECRYIIRYLPYPKGREKNDKEKELITKAYKNINQVPSPDLYLRIIDNCFNQMEVMIGPGANQGQRTIVHNLIEKYNPIAKISESQLTGKIRF